MASPERQKPPVKLLGEDGNAFSILGKAQRSARKAGWDDERIKAFMDEAMNGDYGHLLFVVAENFEVH